MSLDDALIVTAIHRRNSELLFPCVTMDTDPFAIFLKNPTLERFLELRSHHLQHSGFDPYSREMEQLEPLLSGEKFPEAIEFLKKTISPNHLLNPGAHLKLAYAHQKNGDMDHAELERAIGKALLEGIRMTGNGSPEKPYLVTRTSDEYDILLVDRLEFSQQSLRERDGKKLDVIQTKTGEELWFDVTDIFALIANRLAEQTR